MGEEMENIERLKSLIEQAKAAPMFQKAAFAEHAIDQAATILENQEKRLLCIEDVIAGLQQ